MSIIVLGPVIARIIVSSTTITVPPTTITLGTTPMNPMNLLKVVRLHLVMELL
ncbi:hypothetical protein M408DRAFT_327755, partial [Serendipita vermifera MAFF 305830]